jgi:ferredoxin-NADP reductase
MKLKLINKKEETPNIITFQFEKPSNFSFKPGQYLVYKLENELPDGRGKRRYFTISSAPYEETINLTTKLSKQSSTFKKDLFNIEIGTEIEVTEPGGEFFFDEKFSHHIFVAGGIGVTPFRSMLMDFKNKHQNPNIVLMYANKDEIILFQEELDTLKNTLSNFDLEMFNPENPLTPEAIFSKFHNLENSAIYLSGPEPMVEKFLLELEEMGIDRNSIKRDYFPGYEWK